MGPYPIKFYLNLLALTELRCPIERQGSSLDVLATRWSPREAGGESGFGHLMARDGDVKPYGSKSEMSQRAA